MQTHYTLNEHRDKERNALGFFLQILAKTMYYYSTGYFAKNEKETILHFIIFSDTYTSTYVI